MSIASFIPKIWSARLLDHLDKSLVYANLVNRDYEGEIANMGDEVHINQIGDITVKKYTKNTNIEAPDQLETTDQILKIDKAEYFNFYVDDIDKVQARADLMDKAMQRAAYKLDDSTDSYVASLLEKGTAVTGLGSTSSPIEITEANAYQALVMMKTALDKKNVPSQGRWVVVPPEFQAFMLLDKRFAGADGTNAESRLINGYVGKACGFDIYVSNNVPNTSNTKYKIIGSYNGSATFANQIIKTVPYEPEDKFAEAIKGLHVYGAKVTRPAEIAVLTANFTGMTLSPGA